jgi:hypothetical protein
VAYQFVTNQTPTTGANAIYLFFQVLITAGWTVEGSGDGLSLYSSSGNVLTSGGTGAGGLGNALAWFRIRQPTWNGTFAREFTFQGEGLISGSHYEWRIKYSPGVNGGFNQPPVINTSGATGGSASSTVTPSALDEQVWTYAAGVGPGTDIAPAFNEIFGSDGTYRFHCAAGEASENYTFYMISTGLGTVNVQTCFSLEVMQTGTYNPLDLDPAMVYFDIFSTEILGDNFQRSGSGYGNAPQGFMGGVSRGIYPYSGGTPNYFSPYYVDIFAFYYGTEIPAGLGTNAWTGLDDNLFIPWMSSNASNHITYAGYKGLGTMFYFNAVPRNPFDTITIVNPSDRFYYNGTLIPWPGMLVASVSNNGGLIEITTAQYLNLGTGSAVIIAGTGTSADQTLPWTITQIDNTHFTLNGSTFVSGSTGSGTIAVLPLS